MTKRKSVQDYRKAWRDSIAKKQKIETDIKARLKDICTTHPEIIVGTKADEHRTPIKAKSIADLTYIEGMDTSTALAFIEIIEKELADAHPHQQTKINFDNKYQDFIEYQDDDNDYEPPERKELTEVLNIRLYCMHESCRTYIKGEEGYNGAFTAETGQYCDLRNKGYTCTKHR